MAIAAAVEEGSGTVVSEGSSGNASVKSRNVYLVKPEDSTIKSGNVDNRNRYISSILGLGVVRVEREEGTTERVVDRNILLSRKLNPLVTPVNGT